MGAIKKIVVKIDEEKSPKYMDVIPREVYEQAIVEQAERIISKR